MFVYISFSIARFTPEQTPTTGDVEAIESRAHTSVRESDLWTHFLASHQGMLTCHHDFYQIYQIPDLFARY